MIIALFVLLFILLILGGVGYVVFRKAISRQKDEMESGNLTDKQKEWLSKYSELNAMASKLVEDCPPKEWRLTNAEGLKLVAEYYPAESSHQYAVCIHGYTNGRKAMRRFAAVFHSWGYHVLLPDNRAHGDSEGKWMGMGYLDARDIVEWIGRIVQQDPNAQIFLMGQSMGGATVMMASGLTLPSNVKFLVEDCGYTSVWEEFKVQIRKMHLPCFPFLYIASWWCKLIAGYSFQEASSVKALARNELPILFIHGERDGFVPYAMLDQNVAATHAPKDVLRVPEAGHSLSAAYGKETYFAKIREFAAQYMK